MYQGGWSIYGCKVLLCTRNHNLYASGVLLGSHTHPGFCALIIIVMGRSHILMAGFGHLIMLASWKLNCTLVNSLLALSNHLWAYVSVIKLARWFVSQCVNITPHRGVINGGHQIEVTCDDQHLFFGPIVRE